MDQRSGNTPSFIAEGNRWRWKVRIGDGKTKTAFWRAVGNTAVSVHGSDCHGPTAGLCQPRRQNARFRFAIADSDFPSPTIAFGQLNDGDSTPLYSIGFPPHNNVCEGRLVRFVQDADFKLRPGKITFLRTQSVP